MMQVQKDLASVCSVGNSLSLCLNVSKCVTTELRFSTQNTEGIFITSMASFLSASVHRDLGVLVNSRL